MTTFEQLSALELILARNQLTTLFQPIVSLARRRIHGYEALTRGPSNSSLHAPLALFSVARNAGRLNELEMSARANACARFSNAPFNGTLYLNVCPELLIEPDHQSGRTLEILHKHRIAPAQVVIELTEQTPIEDFDVLHRALRHYRTMGFSIALDDLGAGYSSLRLWSELRPDIVKIDRHFIDGIHLDPLKREFVGSILRMAKTAHTRVIAEGVEEPAELQVLAGMGVDLVQGYLLGRPQEKPAREVLVDLKASA